MLNELAGKARAFPAGSSLPTTRDMHEIVSRLDNAPASGMDAEYHITVLPRFMMPKEPQASVSRMMPRGIDPHSRQPATNVLRSARWLAPQRPKRSFLYSKRSRVSADRCLVALGTSKGLTLLEMLVVVAVMAIIAGGIVLALGRVQDDATLQIARNELVTIKDAILRFKQDTGYLPKQGPFDLEPPNQCTTSNNGAVPIGSLPVPSKEWFCSPANFIQLYEQPQLNSSHPLAFLAQWNPDTRRGWRGPYLTRFGEGLVDIGNGLQPDGSGDPIGGTAALREMPGVADPFIALPIPSALDTVDGQLLDWRTVAGDPPHPKWGRPYLLFDLDDPAKARIVSMGPNKTYDSASITTCPEAGDDDLVLCLLK
ncbi:MAG: prepilin-type N-terminal cleavage/methylation domain-containing protein [Nitrospirae bacterium]|nr:MAG: prepilin-type N-terminal cleavage/methylation domain-containing protein [Nitrospirota bacterium]